MEKIKIAINGFGRIGRSAFKAVTGNLNASMVPSTNLAPNDFELVAINDLTPVESLAYLLKYDSVYGRFDKTVSYNRSSLTVNGKTYKIFAEKDPERLPWKDLEVDVVLECTGHFTEYKAAKAHIIAGSKRVVISAPGKGDEGDIQVFGTEKINKKIEDLIISNASCTTNSIAPVMQILEDNVGVEKSLMTTVHSYTATQNIVDGPNKDPRRGRAGAANIIPTTTGAAAATVKAIPSLKNKFDGIALRVPTLCGSISDITTLLKEGASPEEINQTFERAKHMPLYEGILETSKEPLVSSDILGLPYSGIIDLSSTKVIGGNLAKVLVWYDNEWAYSIRLVSIAKKLFL